MERQVPAPNAPRQLCGGREGRSPLGSGFSSGSAPPPGGQVSAEDRALCPQSVVSPQVPGTSLFAYASSMTEDTSVF